MRPQSVLTFSGENVTVDGQHFSLLEGSYVDDGDFQTDTKLYAIA